MKGNRVSIAEPCSMELEEAAEIMFAERFADGDDGDSSTSESHDAGQEKVDYDYHTRDVLHSLHVSQQLSDESGTEGDSESDF